MKKGLLICIGLFCMTLKGYGQDTNAYQSFFGQESTEWWGMLVHFDYYDFHVIRTTYDTLVDGVLYKKAEHNTIFSYDEYDELLDFPILLREDTRTGRLWCRPIDEDEELLIVDMSLSLGDTITLYRLAGESRGEFVVQNIIDTGSHRTLILKSSWGVSEILFIEGVGCSNIIEYPYSWGIGSRLLCCVKDGFRIYHDGLLEGCYGEPYISIREVESPKISVFPNPCTDWIELDGEDILSINIYDVHGKNVKSFFDTQGRINLSNLPRGMYFLQILMGTTNVYKTIIKK